MMRHIAIALMFALAPLEPSAAPFRASGIVDWSKPPAPTAEPSFAPPEAVRSTLANGMTVLVVESHQLPLVAVTLVVPGAGSAFDPQRQPGLAALAADMIDEATAGMSAIEVAEQQDRLGATIAISAGVDAVHISVDTLATTFDPTVDLLARLVMRPSFEATDFDRVKGDRATALELRRDRPREVVTNVLNAGLYGLDSPYGHPGEGMRDSFRAIAIDDVRAFYRQHWNPSAATIVVVGDVEPTRVRNKLGATLGAWNRAGGNPPKLDIVERPSGHRLLLVDRPGAKQSDVRVGTIGIDRRQPRYFAFEVLSTVLGGGFTSRLTQRLREQLGITYQVRAAQSYRRDRGPFAIATSIETSQTARGLREIFGMLRALARTPIPTHELSKAKQNMIRALPASFDTNSATAQAFAELALFELPLDWYSQYARRVQTVTAAAVVAEAKSTLPAAKMLVSVVGDLSKIRAGLDALGLGEPLLHDPYGGPIAPATQPSR